MPGVAAPGAAEIVAACLLSVPWPQVSFQPGSIVTLPDASAANGLFDAVLSGDVNKVLGQLLPLLPVSCQCGEP